MEEFAAAKIPNMDLSQLVFLAKNGPESEKKTHVDKIIDLIKIDEMAPFYRFVADELKIKADQKLLAQLEAANAAELKKLSERLEDAEKNLGETEISDALIATAQYLTKIGEKEKALTAFRVAYDKTVPIGSRIDIVFSQIRIGFLFRDNDVISRNIEKVKSLIEEGGDWDRRNRLKVYEGVYRISIRDFKGAVDMLLDSLATFASTELMEYKSLVKYAVLTASVTLSRPEYKKKVVDSPEILEVIHEIPHLSDYANSLYECNYSLFFESLAAIEGLVKKDEFLSTHCSYYVREMRIKAYVQLLDSYRSLTVEAMAKAFGVSEEFLDRDLAKFIAAGRVNAVIDRVGGIVQTNRPDAKNAQYQASIKQGDLLLNRIQKLGRVINI